MLFGRVISVGIGYLCGMFLSGFLYGKKENVDLRKVGSGNVGTTNTMRNLGVKAGILTLTVMCARYLWQWSLYGSFSGTVIRTV